MTGRRIFMYVLLVLFALAGIDALNSPTPTEDRSAGTREAETSETYLVTQVIDGDTIEVEIGGTEALVRYIGIDTPETEHSTRGKECYGEEASAKNRELVLGKHVMLQKDVSETDKYGRLLRYVYVNDVFINHKLVEDGFAEAKSYPPDTKYNTVLNAAEQKARASRLGRWGNACSAP